MISECYNVSHCECHQAPTAGSGWAFDASTDNASIVTGDHNPMRKLQSGETRNVVQTEFPGGSRIDIRVLSVQQQNKFVVTS
jgi:hypothetical protein